MIKSYKNILLGYLVLGIWLVIPLAVSAQVINNEVYQSLYVQLESIKSRLLALQSQISASSFSSGDNYTEEDSFDSSRLSDFRRTLENKTVDNESPAITTFGLEGSVTDGNCISGDEEYAVGTKLQQLEASGVRVFINNGQAVCEKDGWQPYLCIESNDGSHDNCSLLSEEPNQFWCKVGEIDVPNNIEATINSGGFGSSAQVLCTSGELQVISDTGIDRF